MSRSAFLALELGEVAREALHCAGWAVQRRTTTMMNVAGDGDGGLGFEATATDRLHMTFVFCGDDLLRLPADRLARLNHQLLESVTFCGCQETISVIQEVHRLI